ncbi:MAG TPA: ribosome biogenesis GTPase Der [Sulfurimonas sp.]|nr:ribosome biogenesis GTPase Der [Sulfurimonas sp.]
MKKLAIIGRPNVGKSSLFNRLLKKRDAITSDQAGTTRDVKKRIAQILDKEVQILDTGGLDKGCELFDKIKEKAVKAAYEADIILYMVDGKTIANDEDKKFFYELQAMGKHICLVVNKIDNDKLKEKLWDYYEFGTDTIFGISVAHNRNTIALIEWIHAALPTNEENREAEEEALRLKKLEEAKAAHDYHLKEFDEDVDYKVVDEDPTVFEENDQTRWYDPERLNQVKVAIIGRVNVGKSSLLNALVGEDRSVVSDVAGTTVDPIDELIVIGDKRVTFVDTAGLRRRGQIEGIEKYALNRTKEMLYDADVALLVLDASQPFKDLDEKIAGLIDENRLGCIIVLNKWDLTDKDYEKHVEMIRGRFKFLHYAPILTISALTNRRVNKIMDMILQINENYSQRIGTSKLNRVIELAQRKHHLPSVNGKTIRLYYVTQYDIRPPRIALILNRPEGLHFTYRRYLTNKLREAFNFEGVPILFHARSKKQRTTIEDEPNFVEDRFGGTKAVTEEEMAEMYQEFEEGEGESEFENNMDKDSKSKNDIEEGFVDID